MVYDIVEIAPEVRVDQLMYHNAYYYRNSQYVREKYNERYYDEIDQNFLMDCIIEENMSNECVQSVLFGFAKTYSYIKRCIVDTQRPGHSDWWFITLTSKEDWSEKEAKEKIDKYRESHFKKYKYIWVEEHGEENEKYHQHILAENKGRFHTGINLKPTQYYDANINVKRVTDTHRSKQDILKYLQKENEPQGDLQHFRSS